jgi:hypothetical protein
MLFFLFVMQPWLPAVPAPTVFVAGGFACLGGIAVAILVFRFLLPIDPARRLRSILVAIVHDLKTMAAADSLLLAEKCQSRTHHRVLRMLANARKLDHDLSAAVEGGLAVLVIGRCLLRLEETAMDGEDSPATSEILRDMALIFSEALRKPEAILSVLTAASSKLSVAMEGHPVGGCEPAS